MARFYMQGERSNHTWQPTVLVNELFVELAKLRGLPGRPSGSGSSADLESERKAFLALAAHIMRRLLIHHARPLARRIGMEELSEDLNLDEPTGEDMAVVEDLLWGLERLDPLLRTIVEMRVLEGLTMEEIAEELDVPLRTIYRRWTFARTWLATRLNLERPLPVAQP